MKRRSMKVYMTAAAALLMVLCVMLTAVGCGCSGKSAQVVAEGKVDNLRWALDAEGCLSFTGTGAIPGVEYTFNMESGQSEAVYPVWYQYREEITEVVIGPGIDSISMNAFMNFAGLRSLDVSSTVAHIDGYAVTGCVSLERVIIRCAVVDMEKYCIGFVGGLPQAGLEDVVFEGISGSRVERYADECGARFDAL